MTKRGYLAVPTPSSQNVQAPLEFFTLAMKKLNLSQRNVELLGQVATKTMQANKPQYLRSKIVEYQTRLKDYYTLECIDVECYPPKKKGEKREKTLIMDSRFFVRVKSKAELVQFLIQERKIEGDTTVKIGIDGGQNFLKIGLVLQKGRDPYEDTKSPIKKKQADGGVRRCLIIGILEDVPETHYNVKKLLDVLDIKPEDVDLTFTTDLKLLNILLGMQGHSASHSCAYCTILTVGRGAYLGKFHVLKKHIIIILL